MYELLNIIWITDSLSTGNKLWFRKTVLNQYADMLSNYEIFTVNYIKIKNSSEEHEIAE